MMRISDERLGGTRVLIERNCERWPVACSHRAPAVPLLPWIGAYRRYRAICRPIFTHWAPRQ
jgi:hypothetical protein